MTDGGLAPLTVGPKSRLVSLADVDQPCAISVDSFCLVPAELSGAVLKNRSGRVPESADGIALHGRKIQTHRFLFDRDDYSTKGIVSSMISAAGTAGGVTRVSLLVLMGVINSTVPAGPGETNSAGMVSRCGLSRACERAFDLR